MKSAVFYGVKDMRVEECPKPQPGPGEVLIKVRACGVCGTDVHIYEGDKGAADCTPPTILGHEFAGEVEAVGSGVQRFAPGDRVCIDPNCYCGNCDDCLDGRVHYCGHMVGYGTTRNGGFAQYCVVAETQVYALGAHTTFAQGAMTEPVACCLHGMDMCAIKPGDDVLVIGGGMIGLIMLQLARLEGAARVVLMEPVEGKRETAKRLGAALCIDPIHEDPAQVLRENGIKRLAAVIECVGRPSTIEQAIALAGSASTVMMFGLTKPDETITLKPFQIFQKEIVLKSSFINPLTQARALKLIDAGRVDVDSMVSSVCALEKLQAVLSTPELRARGKYIVDPWL